MRRWLIAALLCFATAPTLAAMLGNPGGGAPAVSSSFLCGGSNPTCANALSTERQLVSTATNAMQVERSVDSTTQNIGFTGGIVNTSAVNAFCNASVGGVISRNCYISELYDQMAVSGCSIFNSNAAKMPNYMVSPAHGGLPMLQKVYPGDSGTTRAFILDNAGGSDSTSPSPACTTLTGGAQSIFFSGSSIYQNCCAGDFGFQQLISAGGPQGAMFSAFVGPAGYTYDLCVTSSPCGALDSYGQGPKVNYTANSNGDFFDIVTYDDTVTGGLFNVWINNVEIVSANSQPDSLVTEGRLSWGAAGDNTSDGPSRARTAAFYTSVLSPTQVAALYSNETTFISTLSTGYEGPGDDAVVGNETSASPGLSSQRVRQLQWLSQCFSLRKCWSGYEGPAVNICQGSGSCEDIGWVNNVIDTATMSAFCGPVSGLNNCAVQVWYNEALNQAPATNGINTSVDATAVSSSNRPALVFSGCPTTTITVCIQTTSTNYFAVPTTGIAANASSFTFAAVAERTGSFTSMSAIYSSTGTTAQNFIGFNNSANSCVGAGSSTITSVTATCADSAVHSIVVDAQLTGTVVTIYVDGTAGGTHTGALGYNGGGVGLGATGAGVNPCTCTISEVLLYADGANHSYTGGLGSAGVANLLANQEAAFGFGSPGSPSNAIVLGVP